MKKLQEVIRKCDRKYVKKYRCFLFPLLVIGITQHPMLADDSTKTLRLGPDQNVAAIVSAAPAGTTFIFSSGIYRMQSIVPKDNDLFKGEGQVVLNGAKLLEMHQDGALWSADEPSVVGEPGHCASDHPRCWIVKDLFIDDRLQIPVGGMDEVGAGRWYYNETSGKLYISTNPTGHKVELSTTRFAFSGTATGVQISDLIVEKYANPAQNGAIGGNLHTVVEAERATGKAQDWKVLRAEVRWNHGAGIELGANAHIESCNVHHNGQIGLGGQGANMLITNNEIAYNNYAGYKKDFEAGGTKFSATDGLVVRSNYVHNNNGNGLWTDIDNIHTLYEKNTVVDNDAVGIQHEIGYDAIIRNNLVRGNKDGILAVLSPNVEIYGNVIEVPVNGTEGIRIITGQRGTGKYGPHLAHDDYVHDNVITYLGPSGRSGISGTAISGANLKFDSNDYHIVGGGDNHWLLGKAMTLSDMHQEGMEQHSKISKTLPVRSDPTRAGAPE